MALSKRLAVTLPAGPKLEHSIARIKWAEDNGYPDVWFADAGAPDTLTQIAAVATTVPPLVLASPLRLFTLAPPPYLRQPPMLFRRYCPVDLYWALARRARPSWGNGTVFRWIDRLRE